MTYEEAKNRLLSPCGGCGAICSDGESRTCCDWMAFVLTTEALEKQIPRKPKSKYEHRAEEFVCPACETEIKYRVVFPWEKYCPDCGQKLDWSEKEG